MKYLLIAALFIGSLSHAELLRGQIIGIADGDTVTLLSTDNERSQIRLSGIDAPEKNQAFGSRSKESLSRLIFGKSVIIKTTINDRYGRKIGKILIDGTDANLEQIKLGMAWHYKAYQREQSKQDRKLYRDAESEARASKQGLWRYTDPTPPWDFRKTGANTRLPNNHF